MFKNIVLGAGAALALLLSFASPASAQTHGGGQATYDDSVARDQCAPRHQVMENGAYVGCSAPAPQRIDRGNRPPVLAMATGGGPAQGGGLEFVTTESALAMYGEAGVDALIAENYRACQSIERRQGWSRVWSFIRPVLTVTGIVVGASEFGDAYGLLLGLSGLREEVGARIHEGDTRDWRRLMIAHCTLAQNYERRYGGTLTEAGTSAH